MKPVKCVLYLLFFILFTTNITYAGRYYDCRVARWMTPDPMMQKYPSWSPYNYCLDNPLVNIDPDGRKVTITVNRSYDNRSVTMGKISVTSDKVATTFSGYTLEPSSSDPDNKSKASTGSHSAYQRYKSADGKTDYDPARIHMVGVKDENGNDMPGAQIHVGNTVKNTEGCILPGTTQGTNSVGNSTTAMENINSIIDADNSGEITVIINNPEPPPPPPPQPPRDHDDMVSAAN